MTTRTLGKSGPTVSALGLGCMGMSRFLRPRRPGREHRHHPRGARRRHHPPRHRRLLRHGPQRDADRRSAQGPRPQQGSDQRQVRRPARPRRGRGSATMPARQPPRLRSPIRCSASAPTTSTSTGPAGSTRTCRSRRPSAAIADLVKAGYVRAHRPVRGRRRDDPPGRRRPSRSPISRSSIRSSRAASRTTSCRPAASSASASPPMACSRAA